jgi:hypothetical protein
MDEFIENEVSSKDMEDFYRGLENWLDMTQVQGE